MQNYYCPLCGTVFEMARAPKNGVPVCTKPGCVKKKQRYIASGEWEAVLAEVKHGPTELPVTGKESPKKPSTSHVVQLKQRTMERIRKARGPSSTPKTEIPQGPDVPPFVEKLKKTSEEMIASGKWKAINPDEPYEMPVSVETAKLAISALDEIMAEDATTGLPPKALPEKLMNPVVAMHERIKRAAAVAVEDGSFLEDGITPMIEPEHVQEADRRHGNLNYRFTQLPVENSTAINQQAKAVLATKVPVQKLDPNSDAATLARLNAAQKKPNKKGGEP